MYEHEIERDSASSGNVVRLTAREIETLSSLMRELRELTQSRRSFAAASDFLRRLGAEAEGPRLIPADTRDR